MQEYYQLSPDQADLQTRKKIHRAVLENSKWFGDGLPIMDEKFNAAQTDERRELFVEILRRAARRESNVGLSRAYPALADKLDFCGDEKCGSSACPTCRRAYQRVATVAQTENIQQLSDLIPGKGLVFVTIVPVDYCFPCGTLHQLDIHEFNSALIGRLQEARLLHPLIGAVDFSLERTDTGLKYWQPHWHLNTWTRNRASFLKQLNKVFPRSEKYERPVDVRKPRDLNFFLYANKGFKIIHLLRNGRRQLPEFLLAMDRIDPLDLMVFHRFEMCQHAQGFKFETKGNWYFKLQQNYFNNQQN